jgi:site-specific DNA-methyltransferase (adenine-specific)
VTTTHKTDLWETPQPLFDKLDEEFHFVLDCAANAENAKCRRYLCPLDDALSCSWGSTSCDRESFWLNPPYGDGIDKWVEKAYRTSGSGVRVVCLLPVRTNPPWWHDYVMKAREIRFIRSKVSFGGPVEGVPFWGSAIVVFGPGVTHDPPLVSSLVQPDKEAKEARRLNGKY